MKIDAVYRDYLLALQGQAAGISGYSVIAENAAQRFFACKAKNDRRIALAEKRAGAIRTTRLVFRSDGY